jgi:hypothetical protein
VPCRRTQILRNLVHLFLSCALNLHAAPILSIILLEIGPIESDTGLEKMRITGFDKGATQKHQNHKEVLYAEKTKKRH